MPATDTTTIQPEATQTGGERDELAAIVSRRDGYVHFAVAIRLGNAVAGLDRFQGRPWADIEPKVRQTWEEQHARPWAEFCPLVRQTWAKASRQFTDTLPAAGDAPDYQTMFHQHYEQHFRDSDYDYRQYAPAYYYGFDLAVDQRLRQYRWEDIQPFTYLYWQDDSFAGAWPHFEAATRFAWEQVRQHQA